MFDHPPVEPQALGLTAVGIGIGLLLGLLASWLYVRTRARTSGRAAPPSEREQETERLSRPPTRNRSGPRRPPPPPPRPRDHLTDHQVRLLTRELIAAIETAGAGSSALAVVTATPTLRLSTILPREMEQFDPTRHQPARPVRTSVRARHGSVAQVLEPGLRTASGAVVRPATVRRYEFLVPPPSRPTEPAGDGRPPARAAVEPPS